MAGWGGFALAFAVFFLSHSVPIRPPLRPVLERALGRRGFAAAYSALSVAVLGWLIVAAGRAPAVLLWPRLPWQTHAALALMLAACLLAALAIGRPNPFSFGGGDAARFDPARPGIVRIVRHPLLAALALWALAHLLANGELAHVILFGVFGGFALLGMRLIDRRRRRERGADWTRTRAAVAAQPWRAPGWAGHRPGLRIAAGVAVWAGLIALHPLVIGVGPLP